MALTVLKMAELLSTQENFLFEMLEGALPVLERNTLRAAISLHTIPYKASNNEIFGKQFGL